MGRLLGPDANARLVYIPGGTSLGNAVGRVAVVYAAATGSTLADIRTYDGTDTPGSAITGSQLTVDADSYLPLFWFPDNVDTVYVEVAGGTRVALHADYDTRIDRISANANAPLISTGVTSGGDIAVNGVNTKAIDIDPLVGYVVDVITDPTTPTVTRVATTTTTTVELDAVAQTRIVTWWLMDSTGAVIQQATRPTNTQRRTHLQLAITGYDQSSGTIFTSKSSLVIHAQAIEQLYDLMYALGNFSVSGSTLSANGANLSFDKTVGVAFEPSWNHFSGGSLTNDPHSFTSAAQSPVQFRHLIRTTVVAVPALVTTLDVANYDENGVLTAIGGGINQSSTFRVFVVAANDTTDQVVVQYGQTTYTSLAGAQAAINTETFVINPEMRDNGALIGYICAIRSATDLSDPAQASFHPAGKFERP